jgi:hypothetical protein
MLLFSRLVTLRGSPRQTLSWATRMTEYVNERSGLDVSLWSSTFGAPLGTMAWTAMVESQVALADGANKLLVDDGYFDLLEEAADLVATPGEDSLRELIHGQPGERAPIGAVATITTAIALVDQMADAVGWSVAIAQHVTEISATPVSVLTNVYGQMGQITWIGVQPDLAAAEAARTTIGSDADYLGRLAATKELFLPGSGHVSNAVRVA